MLQPEGQSKLPDRDQPVVARPESDSAQLSPQPAPGELPFEPPESRPPESEESPPVAVDAAEQRRQLRHFYSHGRTPAERVESWPALIYAFKDLSRVRYQYPLCIAAGAGSAAGAQPAEPLAAIIDRLVDGIGLEGDQGQRIRHHLLQLEAVLKAVAEKKNGGRLEELWTIAAARLVAASKLSDAKKKRLRQDLQVGREALSFDGDLVCYGADVPARLFAAAQEAYWFRHSATLRARLDDLIIGLEEILRTDFDHSPEARSSRHLRDSVGGSAAQDMDFDKLSAILNQAQLGEPLPATRRRRVQQALETLRAMLPLFDPAAPAADLPFPLSPLEQVSAVAGEQRRRTQAAVALSRAARIAELEIANRYRDTSHDGYFAAFDRWDLRDEELGRCPAPVLHVSQDTLSAGDAEALLELLGSGEPVQVVLTLNKLMAEDGCGGPGGAVLAARLPRMAVALNGVFVLQCSASRPDLLQSGMLEGLRYHGPSLFAVYVGSAGPGRLPSYLDAAAAADCRAFPAFRFDPGAGHTQAQRAALLDNPRQEQPWPRETFRHLGGDGAETQTELIFTVADYLYCDPAVAAHFWRLPVGPPPADLVPMEEFVELPEPATGDSRIPYITVVTAAGEMARVAVSRAIVAALRRCASDWRALQEWGGVNNSFAESLLDRERERLEAEHERRAADVEGRYQQLLDRHLGDLTEEIVARIAAQLLNGEAMPLEDASPGSGPEPPATDRPIEPPASAAAAPEPAPEDEDEEAVSLDEPYIDTPLCTSCDDCTNMSPQVFAYDDNKQAYIKDAGAGSFKELVLAAEKCPVNIIHPGKPRNPDEPGLQEWIERARPFK